MRIKLDDTHWLNSDPQCYWITKVVTIKKGNNAGKTYERRCSGYTATFAGAVDTFIECKIRESKIESFTELKKAISDIKREVRNWKCAVERG